MATGRNTEAIDRITAKTPSLTLIVCDTPVGNTNDIPLTSVPLNGYITRKQFNANVGGQPAQAVFTNATGLTINWQTDLPNGLTSTYVTLLGNNFPKPFIYISTGTNIYTLLKEFNMTVNYDTSGNITTVVFDWTTSMSGTIQF